MTSSLAGKRVCVTGGAGFLGRRVVNILQRRDPPPKSIFVPRSCEYNLIHEADARRLFADCRPDVVIHLAAVVGGIGANHAEPGRFFYENLAMGIHLIEEARRRDIRKFVQVGTVCSYPKFCSVPFQEDDLWEGYPEETNAPYGVAKRALLTMLASYQSQYGLPSVFLLPVNLYGPGDNFDADTSHVIPALIRKMEAARIAGANNVECWGTGDASREFLFVSDAAEAIVLAAERIETPVPINLGTGVEISIRDVAEKIAAACGFKGVLQWNNTFPDGQPRRCLDTQRAKELLAWEASKPFESGLDETIAWYRSELPAPS